MKGKFIFKALLCAMTALASDSVSAQDFNKYFDNQTLRVNFILGGDAQP